MRDAGSEPSSSIIQHKAGRGRPVIRDDARAGYGEVRRPPRDGVRTLLLAGSGVALIVAIVGAGALAGGAETAAKAKTLEQQVVERERQVATLDSDRKEREATLAELQKKLNAKEAELAEAGERVAALEQRRSSVQNQLAELTAPVTPDSLERAAIDGASEPRGDDRASIAPLPPERGETPESSASVDDAPRDDDARLARAAAAKAEQGDVRPSRVSIRGEDQPDITTAAASGPTRVYIHVRSGDPEARARARAVAAELKRRGVSFVEIRGVRLPVRRDAVRYFYDADREALTTLQNAVRETDGADPVTQDFRSFGAPPRQGTIELWLS